MEYIVTIKAWVSGIIPAAIGSLLSLFMSKEKAASMRKWELLAVFCFGVSLAHYLGGGVIEYNKIDPHGLVSDAIKFTIGMLGMASLASIMAQIPLIVEGLRKKFIGE
jgi:hypothetical protein